MEQEVSALNWWEELGAEKSWELKQKYFPDCYMLNRSEIKHIYLCETKKEGANWQKKQGVIIIRQLLEAVKIQETSLLTYGKHPLIEMQVNDAIQKATKFLNK